MKDIMNISEDLQKVLDTSTFKVHEGEWIYAKVNGATSLEDCFMMAKDSDEITAVFEKSKADKFEIIDQNKDLRKLIEVRVSAPFYAVGFLAAITGAISSKGCNNLVISTYSKDYVMVTLEHFDNAIEALEQIGIKGA